VVPGCVFLNPDSVGMMMFLRESQGTVGQMIRERFSEPFLLNAYSIICMLLGGFRQKVELDLIVRRPYAFGLLRAADLAVRWAPGIRVYAIEFGVAAGAGLMNMAGIATRVAKTTGVEIEVVGFDTGVGLPPPEDYRDHPEYWGAGDYPPIDRDRLSQSLPDHCRLIYGDVAETIGPFMDGMDGVIGFVSIDVDYYSSAKSCLKLFASVDPTRYLPLVPVYFDDVLREFNNSACGERLAIREFNELGDSRLIEPYTGLREERIFKNARYISKMYALHVLDHPLRQVNNSGRLNHV
jgi:hypothetical protein